MTPEEAKRICAELIAAGESLRISQSPIEARALRKRCAIEWPRFVHDYSYVAEKIGDLEGAAALFARSRVDWSHAKAELISSTNKLQVAADFIRDT